MLNTVVLINILWKLIIFLNELFDEWEQHLEFKLRKQKKWPQTWKLLKINLFFF